MNAPNTPQGHDCHKTVLELDLAAYSDIASALEENLDVEAVKTFQDQIQSFVDVGLNELGLHRDEVVFATAGDNALLIFDDPGVMHKFAKIVQEATAKHNSKKSVESAKRWFRMGAATGAVLLIPAERRIVGTTVARAVRLEAAADKGELLVDMETYEGLPEEFKKLYGPEEVVAGKRDEHFTVRRIAMISPAAHLEKLQEQQKAEGAGKSEGKGGSMPQVAPAATSGQGRNMVMPIVAVLAFAALAAAAFFYFHAEGLEKTMLQAGPVKPATNQVAVVPPVNVVMPQTNRVTPPPNPVIPPSNPVVQPVQPVQPDLPKTLVVPDQYASVAAAVRAARPGDTVSIKTGIYDGPVFMKSGIKLIGESRDTVTLRAPATNTVISLYQVKDVFISNVTIEHADKLPPEAKVRDNLMYIMDCGGVTISGCRLQNGNGNGISINNSKPTISDCLVRWNAGDGIFVFGARSQVELAHNQVQENQINGILFTAGATGTAEQNECAGNKGDGLLAIGAATAPDLKANQSHDNRSSGIRFAENAGGIAEQNVCSQNGMNGIELMGERTAPDLKGNQCLGNKAQGIFYFRGANGTAEGNKCSQNNLNGILVSDAGPTLKSNQCTENTLSGIRFARKSSGDAEQNNCSRNKQSGIAVFGDSTPRIHSNTSRDNGDYGIWCQQTSQPDLSGNQMSGNTLGALTTTGTVPAPARQ